tara:strand:+ start:1063 stop:1899 length:837 start_codon:yes stop_codon:yes gene_type:complete
MEKIFIIAEIGINHNGDMDTAKKLIKMAKRCGCDAVKFQKRDLEIVYTKNELVSKRESPWGTTFKEQKEGLEFNIDQYKEIDKFCKDVDIEWFASAWDINSLNFLDVFNLKYGKVASALITHKDFLLELAKRKKYTFISTGMSEYKDIDNAVEIFKSQDCPFEIMHCVSTYPCPEEILNLNIISRLKEKYSCKVGYSGHESGVVASVVAATYGISSLERHITLDRSMYGSDQSASLEETGLKNLVDSVKKVPIVNGTSDKKIFDQEKSVASKLRYWEK